MKTHSSFRTRLQSSRFLRYALLGLAVLGSLIALFYAFENWRGAKAWAETMALREQQGIPTDRRDLLPVLPADSDNFCAIPIFQEYQKDIPDQSMKLDDSESTVKFPSMGSILSQSCPSLAEIAAYYRKHPAFPQASSGGSDADIILAALGKYRKERDEMVRALGRSEALFPVNFGIEEPWAIALPHVGRTINISRALSLHAIAALAAGKTREAMEDVQIQFRLIEALSKEPLLISQLVNATVVGYALQSIYCGLGENKWSGDDLQTLATLLRSADLVASGQLGMRGEEILFFFSSMDFMKKASPPQFQTLLMAFEGNSNLFNRTTALALCLVPDGWYDSCKVVASPIYQEYLINPADPKNHRIFVPKIEAAEELLATQIKTKLSPSNIFLAMVFPATSNAWRNLAQSQCLLDMGLIACELELHRLKQGSYPESLSQVKALLPHDPLTGEPYHYQRTPDHRYRLWSVGWNLQNEDGNIAYKNKEKKTIDRFQGDWPWAYPPR